MKLKRKKKKKLAHPPPYRTTFSRLNLLLLPCFFFFFFKCKSSHILAFFSIFIINLFCFYLKNQIINPCSCHLAYMPASERANTHNHITGTIIVGTACIIINYCATDKDRKRERERERFEPF